MMELNKHFVVDIENAKHNVKSEFKGKYYRITILSERLIRFEYSVKGEFFDSLTSLVINRNFSMPNIEVKQNDKILIITSKYFTLKYRKDKPFKGNFLSPDYNLSVKLNGTDKVWYPNHPEARNFKGVFSSIDTNYINRKSLYSTDGFATMDDSSNFLLNSDGFLSNRLDNNVDTYLFMYKRDFGMCLSDYFKLTGKPSLLPRHALGVWWHKERIYSASDTVKLIKQFNKHEIPLSVLLLSEFWHIKDSRNMNLYKSGYTFNDYLFSHPKDNIEEIHKYGVKLGLHLDPSEGIRKSEPSYEKIFGMFNIKKGDAVPFNVYDKNFVSAFLNYIIDPLINLGVDFFWIDYNNNIKTLEALNYYIVNNYKKNLNQRPMVLSRNPMIASHRYPVHYSGKTNVSWNTLNNAPALTSNSSNMGLSWWSHDVGGYHGGIEEDELYLRYVQFSCFSPIFRFSSEKGFYYKREPWLWDMKTYAITKKYLRLRHKLIPYLYTENYNYHKNGNTLVQPVYYYNPEIYDEPIYKNEYMFGSQFLIAPITSIMDKYMNRSIEKIFLPEGTWYDFFSGKKFIGNKRYVVFYKSEDFPVFVKEGAIIPMSIFNENINDMCNPESLEINIFPGKNNLYKLYEDDGYSRNFEVGSYFFTNIEYSHLKNDYAIKIKPFGGDVSVIPKYRNYIIKLKNTRKPSIMKISLNGEEIKTNFLAYEKDMSFIIEVNNIDVTKELIISIKGQALEIDAQRILNEDINSILNDLNITTNIKDKIADILFSKLSVKRKRIRIRQLKKYGLDNNFIHMFLKLLEYSSEI